MRLLVLIFCFFIMCSAYGRYPDDVKNPVNTSLEMKGDKTGHLTLSPFEAAQSSREASLEKEWVTSEFDYLQLKSKLVIRRTQNISACAPLVSTEGYQPAGRSISGAGYESLDHIPVSHADSSREMMTLYFKNGEHFTAEALGKWASWITVRVVSSFGQKYELSTLRLDECKAEYVSYKGEVKSKYLGMDIEDGLESFLYSSNTSLTLELYPFCAGYFQSVSANPPLKFAYEWKIPAVTFKEVIQKGGLDPLLSNGFLVHSNGARVKLRLSRVNQKASIDIFPDTRETFNFKSNEKITVSACKPSSLGCITIIGLFSAKLKKLDGLKKTLISPLSERIKESVNTLCSDFCFTPQSSSASAFTASGSTGGLEQQPPWLSVEDPREADYYRIRIIVE